MGEKYFAQPSVMGAQAHFAKAPNAEIQRSKFDRSHAVKTTFDGGKLIPIFLDEVLPGDTFHLDTTMFTRLATPLKPIMDNLYLDVHYFFVPNRLVWDQWQEFMGERPYPSFDPDSVSPPMQPLNTSSTDSTSFTVAEYFGLPQKHTNELEFTNQSVSCLPFRAYKLIWNEWYRDQNLQSPEEIAMGDYDSDLDLNFDPYRRGKRHDYFTSCLPWPQKGDPVVIPLTGDASVYGFGPGVSATSHFMAHDTTGANFAVDIYGRADGELTFDNTGGNFEQGDPDVEKMAFNPFFAMGYADLDSVSAVTINQLRTAFQIQKMLERDARGGTRYIELILSHFGVRSDDARLQRPEYLGGGSTRININPIASTAVATQDETTIPQANLSAIGTGLLRDAGFTKSFTEHGLIIGLASVRADLTYQRTISRMWQRLTRYDYYWPSLAHLGEQAVYRKELFFAGGLSDDQVFGYQERYAEYRYKPSLITGAFNSDHNDSLDVWHLAQDFSSQPLLNAQFIRENPPISRVVAVATVGHEFLADIWHDLKCDRPMPVYSVPGLIDHF
ncbi:major capsid protein [Apis mellifera associated microvirus 10]|nr:major capsid protein [Apis mellifera associated microvirus 10]